MKYKIVEVDETQHSIVVRFFTDEITEAQLAVQTDGNGNILRCTSDFNLMLPVPAPTGAELAEFILARAPFEWMETLEKVADPMVNTSLSTLAADIGVVRIGTKPVKPAAFVY